MNNQGNAPRKQFRTLGSRMRQFGRRVMRTYAEEQMSPQPQQQPSPAAPVVAAWKQQQQQQPLNWQQTAPPPTQPVQQPAQQQQPVQRQAAPSRPRRPENPNIVNKMPDPQRPVARTNATNTLRQIMALETEKEAARDEIRQQKKETIQRAMEESEKTGRRRRPRRGQANFEYVSTENLLSPEERQELAAQKAAEQTQADTPATDAVQRDAIDDNNDQAIEADIEQEYDEEEWFTEDAFEPNPPPVWDGDDDFDAPIDSSDDSPPPPDDTPPISPTPPAPVQRQADSSGDDSAIEAEYVDDTSRTSGTTDSLSSPSSSLSDNSTDFPSTPVVNTSFINDAPAASDTSSSGTVQRSAAPNSGAQPKKNANPSTGQPGSKSGNPTPSSGSTVQRRADRSSTSTPTASPPDLSSASVSPAEPIEPSPVSSTNDAPSLQRDFDQTDIPDVSGSESYPDIAYTDTTSEQWYGDDSTPVDEQHFSGNTADTPAASTPGITDSGTPIQRTPADASPTANATPPTTGSTAPVQRDTDDSAQAYDYAETPDNTYVTDVESSTSDTTQSTIQRTPMPTDDRQDNDSFVADDDSPAYPSISESDAPSQSVQRETQQPDNSSPVQSAIPTNYEQDEVHFPQETEYWDDNYDVPTASDGVVQRTPETPSFSGDTLDSMFDTIYDTSQPLNEPSSQFSIENDTTDNVDANLPTSPANAASPANTTTGNIQRAPADSIPISSESLDDVFDAIYSDAPPPPAAPTDSAPTPAAPANIQRTPADDEPLSGDSLDTLYDNIFTEPRTYKDDGFAWDAQSWNELPPSQAADVIRPTESTGTPANSSPSPVQRTPQTPTSRSTQGAPPRKPSPTSESSPDADIPPNNDGVVAYGEVQRTPASDSTPNATPSPYADIPPNDDGVVAYGEVQRQPDSMDSSSQPTPSPYANIPPNDDGVVAYGEVQRTPASDSPAQSSPSPYANVPPNDDGVVAYGEVQRQSDDLSSVSDTPSPQSVDSSSGQTLEDALASLGMLSTRDDEPESQSAPQSISLDETRAIINRMFQPQSDTDNSNDNNDNRSQQVKFNNRTPEAQKPPVANTSKTIQRTPSPPQAIDRDAEETADEIGPGIDMEKLARDVYRELQKRLRIERDRRR